MGLGPTQVVSLQEARVSALQHRRQLLAGEDPIEARRVSRSAGTTFGDAADAYIASHRAGWKNEAQAEQWEQSLRTYGPARDTPVGNVDTHLVMACLRPIWTEKTVTATRVRGRIERVLDWAKVVPRRRQPGALARPSGEPASQATKVIRPKHHDAMPYADVPAFMAALAGREARSRRAPQFMILTAARTAEVTGADWPEFDLEHRLWIIPASRMKGGREHIVPLTNAALAILEPLSRQEPPFALSENAMLYLVQKPAPKGLGLPFTVHGFRSSFRDWVAETTDYANEVVEMAMAHAIKNKAEAAYRRGHLLDKRRPLMDAWANFLQG